MSKHTSIEVAVDICAEPETVWRFLSEDDMFVAWISAMPGAPVAPGSFVQARVGGDLCIHFPNGVKAMGKLTTIEPKKRVVFTWGYEPDVARTGLGPGACTVEVSLLRIADGTRVVLRHSGPMSEQVGREHMAGWKHYLAMLASQAAAAQHDPGVAATLESYYTAWRETDAGRRAELLAACCSPEVRVRTTFACTGGIEDLSAHIANGQRAMPGITLGMEGRPEHLHGFVKSKWAAKTAEGHPVFSGDNFVQLTSAGKISLLVGFMGR